ncbi:MAG: TraR/DksA C4-type zinc finger protein [bacterium]|nr:TraR/DksA C4-type zinc finger protein [bacterium]
MTIDYNHFKTKLEEEKAHLKSELEGVARQNPDNPDNPDDWVPIPGEQNTSGADENTAADNIEDYSENNAIVNTLEVKYNAVKKSLNDINNGTYGLCDICGKEIEIDRLEANPSARTCKEHMK